MRSVRAVAVLSAVIVALGVGLGVRGQAAKGPINLGLIVPATGPLAANGKDMVNALQLFLEQRQNKLAGRPVNLIIEDDAGVPATGLTKARSLIDGNRIHVLIGPLSAAVGYAIAPYVTEKKFPTLFPIVSSEDITQRKRSEYIVRTGWTSAQPSHPFGKYSYDTLHYKRIAMIGYDFSFGWEVAAGFQRTFEDAGGQIAQKLWSPPGTAGYRPHPAPTKRAAHAR